MSDAPNPAPDALDDAEANLGLMLALANRELVFLHEHLSARPEISDTQSGAEFLDALEIARLALMRVRAERSEADPSEANPGHNAVHDAISALQRDKP